MRFSCAKHDCRQGPGTVE